MVDAVVPEVAPAETRLATGFPLSAWIFFPALHSRKCKKRKGFSGGPVPMATLYRPGRFPFVFWHLVKISRKLK